MSATSTLGYASRKCASGCRKSESLKRLPTHKYQEIPTIGCFEELQRQHHSETEIAIGTIWSYEWRRRLV